MPPPLAEVSRKAPRSEQSSRIAAYTGSFTGLVGAWVLGSALPIRPAKDQLPGYAALHGVDLRRQLLLFFLAVALPLAGGMAAAAWARRRRLGRAGGGLERPEVAPRVRGDGSGGFRFAVICAHALVVFVFLVSGFPGVAEAPVRLLGVVVAASAGLALLLGGGDSGKGVLYLGAASPVLFLTLSGQRPIPFARTAAAAAVALPILATLAVRMWPRTGRLWRALTVGVLLPGSITALAAAAVLGAPPIADVFEDGHALLPASEYLRGELPYRDVIPGHGLLTDGLFHAAGLSVLGDDYRGFHRANKLYGALFWPAFYVIGLAATGNPATGFWLAALSFLCFPQFAFHRLIASAATLALALLASRTGNVWAWRACGVALVLGFCSSVDFAIYASAAVLVALAASRDGRNGVRGLLGGAWVAGTAVAVGLAALGLLAEFARTTFSFLPSLLPVYALGFPALPLAPDALNEIPAIPLPLLYGLVAMGTILLGAELPSGYRVSDGARAALPVLAWLVFSMLSVLERRHVGYVSLMVPAGIILLARWFRGAGRLRAFRTLAAAAGIAALALSHRPAALARSVASSIRVPYVPPDFEPLAHPPRARGALFHRYDRTLIQKTAEMMGRAGFRAGDTWLDFANEPGLYFLFDRPCPIRYYEAAFYESESRQREVIDAVARNPRVRAVLVRAVYPPIDGIPSAVRAPLVNAYLRERFRPFFDEDGIEFWLREP